MSLNNLRPPKGAKHPRSASAAARDPGTARRRRAATRARKSRSGFRFKRGFEGGQMPLHRRVPKRGFHNPFRVEYAVVNLDTLAEVFEAGSSVTPELLRERGLVRDATAQVKVLGRGDIAKKLTVQAHKFSGSAAEKIAAAGGTSAVIVTGETVVDMDSLKNIFAIPELRKRVLFTFGLLAVYRRWRAHPDARDQHRRRSCYWRNRRLRAVCSACTTCSRAATCRR